MEDGVSLFPLLDLPKNPLKCVLKHVKLFYLLNFSLISERSKELVKSLNIKVSKTEVSIRGKIKMMVYVSNMPTIILTFNTDQVWKVEPGEILPLPTEMYTPSFVHAHIYDEYSRDRLRHDDSDWTKPGFEIKDWIDYFLSIFNRSKIDTLCFGKNNRFNLKSLQQTVNDVSEIEIQDSCSATYIQKVIQTYSSAKKLEFCFDNERRHENYHSIFCQNFDVLRIDVPFHDIVRRFDLNDLLVLNSRSIDVYKSKLSHKDMNTFLKHWMNGSNERMEYMSICFKKKNRNREDILRGLNYRIVPTNQQRVFKSQVDGSNPVIVKGGYNIRRMDGTTATIIIHRDKFLSLEVFVWD